MGNSSAAAAAAAVAVAATATADIGVTADAADMTSMWYHPPPLCDG